MLPYSKKRKIKFRHSMNLHRKRIKILNVLNKGISTTSSDSDDPYSNNELNFLSNDEWNDNNCSLNAPRK